MTDGLKPCTAAGCNGGWTNKYDKQGHQIPCDTCHGTGLVADK
jgi:hypothetical protein